MSVMFINSSKPASERAVSPLLSLLSMLAFLANKTVTVSTSPLLDAIMREVLLTSSIASIAFGYLSRISVTIWVSPKVIGSLDQPEAGAQLANFERGAQVYL